VVVMFGCDDSSGTHLHEESVALDYARRARARREQEALKKNAEGQKKERKREEGGEGRR